MRIFVAGKDHTPELGAELTRRAGRHQGALSPWSARDSALSLKSAKDMGDYLDRYNRLMRLRYALCTDPFPIPGKPGTAGTLLKKLKAFLWKLFRYQHDRMAQQQNSINELVISGQSFQTTAVKQQIEALEKRIQALENGPPKAPLKP
jgi:hypothetical protein